MGEGWIWRGRSEDREETVGETDEMTILMALNGVHYYL